MLDGNRENRTNPMLAFGGLLVAMFIAALDQTIMATALPTRAAGGLSELRGS